MFGEMYAFEVGLQLVFAVMRSVLRVYLKLRHARRGRRMCHGESASRLEDFECLPGSYQSVKREPMQRTAPEHLMKVERKFGLS